MSNDIEKRGSNPVTKIKNYLADIDVKKRLEETLGKRAGAFGNSIINVVKNSSQLQNCTPDSIMSAAMIAATMNLPIDPALGYAAIIPYKNTAQFQLMYKGIVQLCIRSGQYAKIHNSEVYKDEIKLHNPITGEIKFNNPETYKMRKAGKFEDVAGFYAYFKLTAGFEVSAYMGREEVMSHAKKFSKAYQYDLSKSKRVSVWSTDPMAMGRKTVLKMLLTKYGVMSIEMQDAFIAEHEDFDSAQNKADETIKAEAGSEVIDTDFEDEKLSKELEAKKKKAQAELKKHAKKSKGKKAEQTDFMNQEND